MFEENTAQGVYQKLCGVLDAHKWTYQKDDEKLQIKVSVNGKDLPMHMLLSVNAERNLVMLYSAMPFKVDETKRLDMAIMVCAVNSLLVDGNFVFNVENGTLGFCLTQSFLESDISAQAFDMMITVTCGLVDQFNDKFMAISTGELDFQTFLKEWFTQ